MGHSFLLVEPDNWQYMPNWGFFVKESSSMQSQAAWWNRKNTGHPRFQRLPCRSHSLSVCPASSVHHCSTGGQNRIYSRVHSNSAMTYRRHYQGPWNGNSDQKKVDHCLLDSIQEGRNGVVSYSIGFQHSRTFGDSPFYRWGKWDAASSSRFPKIMLWTIHRARTSAGCLLSLGSKKAKCNKEELPFKY